MRWLSTIVRRFGQIGSTELNSPTNYILFASVYLFYYGQIGALVPYVGVFLAGRGLAAEQIGQVVACITLTRLIGPYLWATFADTSGLYGQLIRFGCSMAALTFIAILWVEGFWQITLVMALMMTFWCAVLPQLEVVTVQYAKLKHTDYGKIRVFGSLGFIAITAFVGFGIDQFNSEFVVWTCLTALSLLVVVTCLLAFPEVNKQATSIIEKTTVDSTHQQQKTSALWSLKFALFLLSGLCLQISFGPYYAFFAVHLADLAYSGAVIGGLIALGAASEIVVLMYGHKLFKRYSVEWLLTISVAVTAIRWLLVAYYSDVPVILTTSQLLHAFSFGLNHIAAIQFITSAFPLQVQSRAQAAYSSICFGVGGATGAAITGMLWDLPNGATLSYWLAASTALIGAFAMLLTCYPRFITKGRATEDGP